MGAVPVRRHLIVRALTVVGAVLVLTACSRSETTAGPATPPPSSTATTTTSAPNPSLPPPAQYQPLVGEPEPEAKAVASGFLQAIGTYPIGEGTVEAAAARLTESTDPSLLQAALTLLDPSAASSTEVVYPQLGGLTADEASVMVVYRQRLSSAAGERTVTRTADIRVARTPEGWAVTAIASLGGEAPPPPPALSPAADAVLSSPAIDLPDTARWDIEAGRIDERVLQLLARLAEQHTLGVTVLATGHPHNVFGTSSVSNHTVGRGVDVWSVDGQPVIAQREPESALQALVQQLVDSNATTELGSPWDLDGVGGASFTNTVHQDHLHLAFDS